MRYMCDQLHWSLDLKIDVLFSQICMGKCRLPCVLSSYDSKHLLPTQQVALPSNEDYKQLKPRVGKAAKVGPSICLSYLQETGILNITSVYEVVRIRMMKDIVLVCL